LGSVDEGEEVIYELKWIQHIIRIENNRLGNFYFILSLSYFLGLELGFSMMSHISHSHTIMCHDGT